MSDVKQENSAQPVEHKGKQQPIALSALEQDRVWESWVSAEVRSLYFAELSGRYRLKQQCVSWLTLILSSGAVATAVFKMNEWARIALPVLTTSVSLYSLVAHNQDRSTQAADLHARWNRLMKEYAALWDDMYARDAKSRFQKLDELQTDLAKAGTQFPNHAKDLSKWTSHVMQRRGLQEGGS